ncbi:MAG: DUF445 family protein [Euryarchaeota archaeon]|nr:DUF445 family protein [Euryarchaeota archaeon]
MTVAIITGVGTSLSAWIAGRRAAKKRKAAREARRAKEAAWPKHLTRVEGAELVGTVGGALAVELGKTAKAADKGARPAKKGRQGFSLRLMKTFNLLEKPFLFCGPVLLAWLTSAVFVKEYAPATYAEIKPTVDILVAIVGAAVVGFWTNWIAIKMLFYPRRRNKLYRGVIPERRDELVEIMSNAILQRLISPEIILKYIQEHGIVKDLVKRVCEASERALSQPEVRSQVKGFLYGIIYDFVHEPETIERVGEGVERIAVRWTKDPGVAKVVASITKNIWLPTLRKEIELVMPSVPGALEGLVDHIVELINDAPAKFAANAGNIENRLTDLIVAGLRQLDIKDTIKGQLDRMDEAELERMLTGGVSEELRFIMTAGGVLGLLVGFALVWPVVTPFYLLAAVLGWLWFRFTAEPLPTLKPEEFGA